MPVDPRGPRFAAALTTLILAAVLLTGSTPLIAAQTLVFAAGALLSLRFSPYSVIFRRLVRPHLAPPAELEPEAPPRFAQAVGAVFGLAATVGFLTGVEALGLSATAIAFGAAFLNAAFGFCIGCEVYVLVKRLAIPARTHREAST